MPAISFPCAAWERNLGCVASSSILVHHRLITACDAGQRGSHAAHGNQKHQRNPGECGMFTGGRTAPSFSCGAWEGVGMRCIQFNPRALRFVCLCITNERRSATQTGRGSHAAHGNQGKRPPLRKIHACLTDKRTNNQITKHDL